MAKRWKTILSWCLALVIAASFANLVSFFYRSGSGSIPRANAFSGNIRTPNSRLVRGMEGYGINYADDNGYINDDSTPLSENYILFMGSSHLEGLQVMQNQNMVTVLNVLFDHDTRTVYNMGTAGYSLPLIIKGFQAGIEEFPHSSAIVIELSDMTYTNEQMTNALDQTRFDPASTGAALVQSQSLLRRVRNNLLSVFPIISLLRQQLESARYDFNGAFGFQAVAPSQVIADQDTHDASAQSDEFLSVLDRAFALLRSEYDNPIIILYHPGVTLLPDGTLRIDREEQYYNDYLSASERYGFVFVDIGDVFLQAYKTDYSLPYGFQNTTLGRGHLNALGHRIVAEQLYQALTAVLDKEN